MFRAIESKIKQNVSSMTTKEKWFLGILAVIVFAGLGLVIGKMICCAMECLAGVLCAMGVLCLGYIIWMVWYIFSKPIERDIVLVKKSYWGYVVAFVVAIPIAVSAILLLCNYSVENICSNSDENSVKQIIPNYSSQPNEERDGALHMLWEVYYHYVDPGNQQDAQGMGDKLLLAILSLAGIFLFNGLLITTLLEWVNQRKGKWSNGTIRYGVRHLHKGRFAVVIGANELASSVIHNLLQLKSKENTLDCLSDKENDYVILQTSSDVQKVRDILASHLPAEFIDRVIIYNALRDSEDEIKQLHLEDATEIYILGENTTIDGGETYHDAMNMRCLNLIAAYLKAIKEELATKEAKCKDEKKKAVFKYKRKACRVLFEYQTTYSVFQFSDVSETVKETMVFIPFNRYESWAHRVFVDCKAKDHDKPIDYSPLDGYEGIGPKDDTYVHLVIVGMSKMGIAMGIQTLLQAHYPNIVAYPNRRTRISFIDTNADKEMAFFVGRYATLFELTRHRYIDVNSVNASYAWRDPMKESDCNWKHLSEEDKNFIDVEIEFVKGELESEGVRKYLRKISAKEQNAKLTIAICLTQTHQAVAAALYMPIEVYQSENLKQILVYQRESADILSTLTDFTCNDDSSKVHKDIRYKKIRPFGMLYGDYMNSRTYYLKSMLVNAMYDLSGKDDETGEEYHLKDIDMGNKSTYKVINTLWKRLSISYVWSNKYFVDTIYQKIRSLAEKGFLDKDESIGGYNNKLFDRPRLYEDLEAILQNKEYKEALAESEHNRWNVQQLLLGYSPCDTKMFDMFKALNDEVQDPKNVAALKKWKEKVGWSSCGPILKMQKKANNENDYESLAKGRFDVAKRVAKNGEMHIHPNICPYKKLDEVDCEAKNYDEKLNDSIPSIIMLVDGYQSSSYQYWKSQIKG